MSSDFRDPVADSRFFQQIFREQIQIWATVPGQRNSDAAAPRGTDSSLRHIMAMMISDMRVFDGLFGWSALV